MSDPRRALDVLEIALSERTPHGLAARVATHLARVFDLALCGVAFHDGEARCASVATMMSEGTAEMHLERFFDGGTPPRLTMMRVAGSACSDIGVHRWERVA